MCHTDYRLVMALRMWLVVVVVAAVTTVVMVNGTSHTVTKNSDHGLGLLDDILANNPSLLCLYVSCQEPVSPDACPEGTVYTEGAAQFGCCGACVAFRQISETCTGSIENKKNMKTPANHLQALQYSANDNIASSSLCDFGLKCDRKACVEDEGTGNIEDPVPCKTMLNRYLRDKLNPDTYLYYRDDYRWKPACTPEGKYEAKQCKGPVDRQRCMCVDPDGNKLFGLVFPEQEELFNSMNCKCSRQVWEKRQAGQSSVTLHCLENGNFEPLQCEDGWCFCVDPDTADPYGPWLPEAAMHILPCYNKTVIGEQYLRRCESELYAHTKLVDAMAEDGVKGPESLTPCDQDGSYSSKQCDQEMCRCWDKYKLYAIAPMSGDGCQCARDKKYYTEINSKITVLCKVNTGEYDDQQVQGNFKFCVDEDGVRSSPLVKNDDKYSLNCENAKFCLKYGSINNYCSEACTTQTGACETDAYANYAE